MKGKGKLSKRTLDTGVAVKSDKLQGRSLAVGITGGIGAVEMVKIIRELRRHGAEVTALLTQSAEKFITPLSIEWACQRQVIKALGADVAHLAEYDAVIVAPATLNTISKAALGLSDNPVTLVIANQLGRKSPLLFVPAMNQVLYHHPLYAQYRGLLESWGATFLESPKEEGRIKMPTPESLVAKVCTLFKSHAN